MEEGYLVYLVNCNVGCEGDEFLRTNHLHGSTFRYH